MDTHRVRRLRWQARAPGPAEAFTLRSLLREHGDACLAALDRAFDSVAPHDEVWHLSRLELKVELADLQRDGTQGLAERVEVAVRAALADAAHLHRRGAGDVGGPAARAHAAGSGRADTAEVSRWPAAIESRQALQHYLATGLLPWTLAGLAPELAQRELREAALHAAESVVSGTTAPDTLLPTARGDARIGALLRWLALLPAPLRRRWVGAVQAAPLPIDAEVSIAWRDWIDADGVERIEWQALWLARTVDADTLRERVEPQRVSAAGVEPPFMPALRLALARVGGTSAASRRAASDAAGVTPASAADGNALAPQRRSSPDDAASHEAAAPEALLVPLAGLVLLHPWITRLLGGCGVLDTTGKQISAPLLPRACALLHALACGDAEPAEHQLPLVKLLLGRAPDEPLTAPLPALTPADHEEIAALLDAVREHWSALRGTAVDGLRLSFLQRRGLLSHGDGAWQLRMQSESFDLLLGLLPWSVGLVRLPWMREPLVVEWPTP